MLCKFYLHIGSSKFVLSSARDVTGDVKNWNDIKTSYSRKDLGGVVRQVSSDVEFIGKARDLILEEFGRNYLHAEASFAIYTIDDNWRYEMRWSCPLDFDSMQDADGVLTMSSIDNSAASLLKSKKSTKYDLTADGEEIIVDSAPIVRYVRIKMSPLSETDQQGYEQVLSNYSIPSGGHVTCYFPASAVLVNEKGEDIPGGSEGDEYLEVRAVANGIISPCDNFDSEYWLVRAKKACRVYLNTGGLYCYMEAVGYPVTVGDETVPGDVHVGISAIGGSSDGGTFISVKADSGDYVRTNRYDCTAADHQRLEIHGVAGSMVYDDMRQYVDLEAGDVFGMAFGIEHLGGEFTMPVPVRITAGYRYLDGTGEVVQGLMNYEYLAAGETPVSSETLSDGLAKLLHEIGGTSSVDALNDILPGSGEYGNIIGEIRGASVTIASTRLLPSSYIKDSAIKKMQLSFNGFASMMEACFGYVYDIERHRGMGIKWGHVEYEGQTYRCLNADAETSQTDYYEYTSWSGYEALDNRLPYFRSEAFCDYAVRINLNQCALFVDCPMDDASKKGWYSSLYYNGQGRQYWDSDYFIKVGGSYYRCQIRYDNDYRPTMQQYYGVREVNTDEDDRFMIEYEKVVFAHRSALFDTSAVKVLDGVNGFKMEVDDSTLYSEVEIGYEKKDYDSSDLEGKEFNGLATYLSGVSLNDRKLTLTCPMRADCMGIEQALRKRSEEKKDDKKEDNDVFIVVCSRDGNGNLIIRKNETIRSDGPFEMAAVIRNDMLHPVRMIEANRELIGMFTSRIVRTAFDGNSDVLVDGSEWEAIDIEGSLARCVKLTVETGDISEPRNYNGLVAFSWQGRQYMGFILDVDFKFAREESATYTLLAYEDD